jgi:hypothetical protein
MQTDKNYGCIEGNYKRELKYLGVGKGSVSEKLFVH